MPRPNKDKTINLNKMLELMATQDINQANLAKKTGLNTLTISHIISEKSTPKQDTIAKIALALGCQYTDLVKTKE